MLAAALGIGDQVLAALNLQDASIVNILRIIGINIVLSGDNAVVIALACRTLPPRQRMLGVILGAGAAVILRIVFTVMIQQLLDVPWLKLIGGLILLWIAVKLLKGEDGGGEDSVRAGSSIWEAVKIVAIADIVMSLDNVLAIAAAAGGDTRLIILGLAISIPLVVFGSTLLMWLLNRMPILVWAGAALLGWIAGELIASEPVLKSYVDAMAASLSVTPKLVLRAFEVIGAVLVVVLGWLIHHRGAPAEHSVVSKP
jgi:YjbE family integral membrane protein